MIDIQSGVESRGIALPRVGINHYKHYIDIFGVSTISDTEFCVNLASESRAIHMSRLVALIEKYGTINEESISNLMDETLEKLECSYCIIKYDFMYIVKKLSPVTNMLAGVPYECNLTFEKTENEGISNTIKLKIPITSVCPCSKAISNYGAHNQRGYITITIESNIFPDIKHIIELLEIEGSSEIFSILKRSDEKYVTEHAYDNAKFVEDVARDIVVKLQGYHNIENYSVAVENFESIHAHNAKAFYTTKQKN